ncbi:type II toxin-antitoxin system YafQ family toxin [Selenomonas sp.]|uniref:type II toxin-antitoxin system YafQ family toxin n=1 Tax=Selenomonas sp. TaxID=2053611 RepID=UPI0025EAB1CA|nr:type II toxin-antitoxin system YafQ family toxin [Selenomonas sp.]MCI6085179.1 type II toxin-antitoxin system YafQ family toxin [Selenomonas sp.]MDY3296258.1 type II toxin-antitoxin system YafQ family toxin [Selenomonas sp.]
MLRLEMTNKFKRDYKLCKKRGLDMSLLSDIVDTLLKEEPLPERCRDHALTGNYDGFRECHIQPDWLLVYAVKREELVLTTSRTGTHSDLF